ncbi:hypothetical protein CDL15_Pgr015536 [Punica granatum]|uniref:Uncharacterized protein n=1 Tax=Punica granatum TaxID=22663 RepID=A0A218W0Q7_PUNGR|nr:hypothetical protein CDL15_Pgr015536 [Punica granatum]
MKRRERERSAFSPELCRSAKPRAEPPPEQNAPVLDDVIPSEKEQPAVDCRLRYDVVLNTFIDESGLEGGDWIAPSLLEAIERSMITNVVLLSMRAGSAYAGKPPPEQSAPVLDDNVSSEEEQPAAESTSRRGAFDRIPFPRCMRHPKPPPEQRREREELAYLMSLALMKDGKYGEALAVHEHKSGREKVKRWTEALTKVASLSGYHLLANQQEAPQEPGERSRLWFHEDVLHVLTEDTGTNKIEGIKLDLVAPEEVNFSSGVFTNMKRLRLFIAHNAYHSGDSICFPRGLRWLEWPEYSSSSLPLNSGWKELVALYMPKSGINILGEEFRLFRNLRFINFNGCKLLTSIPDLSSMHSLEHLDLGECKSLQEVHQSLGHLPKVSHLNFLNCCSLREFPSSLKSKFLQSLILKGCSKLSKFPDILEEVGGVKELSLDETAIDELPPSLGNLIGLQELYLRNCKRLKNIPSSIYKLKQLERVVFCGCSELEKFPGYQEEGIDSSVISRVSAFPNLIFLDFQSCSLSEGLLGNTRVDILHPGSEVPNWFQHRSTEKVVSFMEPVDSYLNIAGLAFYAVVGGPLESQRQACVSCEVQVFVNKQRAYGVMEQFPLLASDNMWLHYVPQRKMWGLDKSAQNEFGRFVVLFAASAGAVKCSGVHVVYHREK